MVDLPEPIPGSPRLLASTIVSLLAVALLGHFWLVPALENYVPRAACDRWLGMNGLSALLFAVTAAAGAGVLIFGFLAARYWRRIERSGQIPPPGALVLRRTQPRPIAEIPARARLARWLPHVGGVVMALCLVMGLLLHFRLVAPNLENLIRLCSGS
ncbi:MAG: hypothetical protein AAGA23_04970 [Pseudomonadota bacterium]